MSNEACREAVDYFIKQNEIKILGPSELGKRKDEYRYRFVMKSTDKQKMIDRLWQWYDKLTLNKNKINNEAVLNMKYSIRGLAGSKVQWYGLDTSSVITENVPLIVSARSDGERIERKM